MAKMRTGRTTPLTTDPLTGARIADPSLIGIEPASGGRVSSWPEVRKLYQSGKLTEDFEGRTLNKEVKNYLEGNTDKLSDIEFEEPILHKTTSRYGGTKTGLQTDYKKGGKMYQSLEKIQKSYGSSTARAEGMINQYDSGETLNSNLYGVGTTSDLDAYRIKPVKKEIVIVKSKVAPQTLRSGGYSGRKKN
jgi:hypothetical protein